MAESASSIGEPAKVRSMRRWIVITLACLGLATIALPSFWLIGRRMQRTIPQAQQWAEPVVAPGNLTEFVQGNTVFACELYRDLTAAEAGNLVCSPLSISAMMAVLYAGAEGETKAEIERALHFTVPERDLHAAFTYWEYEQERYNYGVRYSGSLANSVWFSPDVEIAPGFRRLIEDTYNSQLIQLDLRRPEAATRINEWIALNTSGHITNEYKPPASSGNPAGLVCVNCLDALARWKHHHTFSQAGEAPFKLEDGTEVIVPVLAHISHDQAAIGDGFTVLRIPLDPDHKGEYSLTILLPDEMDGLAEVEQQLTPALLAEIEIALASTETRVVLPEFNLSKDVDVVAALKRLGVRKLFSAEEASLGGLGHAGLNTLYLDTIQHTATIRVDERGVAASAATAAAFLAKGVMMPPEEYMEFVIDHPFVFWVRDEETGLIMFLGHVTDPRDRSGPE